MSSVKENLEENFPESPRDRALDLARAVDEAFNSGDLGEDEIDFLREELQGVGKPEFPSSTDPYGDFYQKTADRWVQEGTTVESVEEDPVEAVSLYFIRREDSDFIRDRHEEKYPGASGETVRSSVNSFDNTFIDMGESAAAFMKYAARRKDNTNGISSQDWYEGLELDERSLEAFDEYVGMSQAAIREIFDPEDDSIMLLRGVGEDAVENHGKWTDNGLELEGGCVEHWTPSPTAAANYSDGYILAAEIPVEDILAASPVNSGTVINLPESYVNRGTETYSDSEIYSAEEADAMELAQDIINSL